MTDTYKILILGASYGSLLGTKMALAGHEVRLVCLPEEVALFNAGGATVLMPIRGREGLTTLSTTDAPGKLDACGTAEADPAAYDLVALAMQEPQYSAPGVRDLMARVTASGTPVMSIMNMPPLTYLTRLPGIDPADLTEAYTDASVWEAFDPDLFTLASPDPQAFRPPEQPLNLLQVSLPTNFKVAAFARPDHTAMLRAIQQSIEAIRFGPEALELPVKLKVHDSLFVPLAKWAMLMTGNYRCVTVNGPRPIAEAVHDDLALSGQVYRAVCTLCESLGADPADMVPFEKYAAAAKGLAKPSSAARALFAGARNIERVDLVVRNLARRQGIEIPTLEETVRLVDERLAANREATAA
ncbi:hypothetical protein KHP62_09265 [Rhodobacteraceae bacterium NNCM2]|nr:hypothetical protein [Coraliihabitans acroporae]